MIVYNIINIYIINIDEGIRSISYNSKVCYFTMLSPNDKECYYYCESYITMNKLIVYSKKYSINSMIICFFNIKIVNGNDIKYETEEFIQSHTRKIIDMINTKYPINQCSNQEFEIKEDEYPKITYNQVNDIDIGGYINKDSIKYFLTNNYYATIKKGSDFYFKRMVYRITVSDIDEGQCNTKANITVTGLDEEYSVIFFADYQRNNEYKKYNLKRRYYSCKYIYIYIHNLIYCNRELRDTETLYDDNCKDTNSYPSAIITIKRNKIEIPYSWFFKQLELNRNGMCFYYLF